MRTEFKSIVFILIFLVVGCSSPRGPEAAETTPDPTPVATNTEHHELLRSANALFKPLPQYAGEEEQAQELIDLGRMLYYEKRLSKDGTISCNSCHNLQAFGVDGESTSLGVGGHRGGRNSPTVYNAALHRAQFWDGRSPDVEDQATGPMLNPVEMAMEKDVVEQRLREIPGYQERFKEAFPGVEQPITITNAALAIAAFERGLVTPGPFDKFLNGEVTALSSTQLEGYKLFVEVGCASCHNGATLGGGQYQKLGLKKPYDTADMGRFEVTGKERDKKKFKVPGLRNIAKTAPYFHDGSVKTLPESINLMAEYQLGKSLSTEEVLKIAAFLDSLTGELDPSYIEEPTLPAGKE